MTYPLNEYAYDDGSPCELCTAEEMQADNDNDSPPEAWAVATLIAGAFVWAVVTVLL